MKQATYIFTDLDDSLLQTLRKCPLGSELLQAAVDRGGKPLSYFTSEQQALIALLEQGIIIPVTGRNSEALDRVHLSFPSYRITSHGALLLGPDGYPDTAWMTTIGNECQRWLDIMRAASRWLEENTADMALRTRIIEDHGMPVYVSIKGEEAALDEIADRIHEIWREEDAQIHRNGENMALLPAFARKELAVAFLMQRLRKEIKNPLFIGLGDSISDLPFMRLCHFAMVPQNSQIRETLWI